MSDRPGIDIVAEIVAAYVSNNAVAPSDLPALIAQVHAALGQLGRDVPAEPAAAKPAVPVRKSVTRDCIYCLEDGKSFKSLRRHLRIDHDMSPEEYRAKWGLPANYPMVAPSYTEARSQLAKQIGLGRRDAPPRRGRKG